MNTKPSPRQGDTCIGWWLIMYPKKCEQMHRTFMSTNLHERSFQYVFICFAEAREKVTACLVFARAFCILCLWSCCKATAWWNYIPFYLDVFLLWWFVCTFCFIYRLFLGYLYLYAFIHEIFIISISAYTKFK